MSILGCKTKIFASHKAIKENWTYLFSWFMKPNACTTFFLNFTTWCSFWNVWRSGSFCCIQKLSEKFSVSYFSKCNFDTCIIKRLKEWKNLIKSSLQMQSCKKVALKNFVRFTGKHLCWSPFLITFQTWEPASNSGVFL